MPASRYNQTYNYDGSVIRYVIVALLAELRNRVYIYQHDVNEADENVLTKVDVPFMYSVTGSERFLKDEFQYDAEANGKAIGDYERVPRGVLQLESISIDASSQMNKFVQTKFTHEIDGELRTFFMRCCFLPLNISFSCNFVCSNQLEMLKLTESVMSKLYAANIFYVDLGIITIQSSYTLPTDYQQQRTTEFGLNEKKEYTVSCSIEVKSFMPVFEHGVLIDEIMDMVKDVKDEGVIMLREDEFGRLCLRTGGIITDFECNVNFDEMPKRDMWSNDASPEKDYKIKEAGDEELQNKRFKRRDLNNVL